MSKDNSAIQAVDNEPLVSIIIPAYNAEKQIERALDSVLAQTYRNIEVIVIDDGSTDKTGYILDQYANIDAKIRIFHVANGGEARSRNLGLSKAVGGYISFCDADDYMHPDMIKKMMAAIQQDISDMAICAWRNMDEEGNELSWRKPTLGACSLSTEEAQKEFLQTGNIEGFCWNKLFKKSLYIETKAQYDIRRLSYCDILANYKLIGASNKISYIGEPLYDYYQISTACTHTVNIKKDYDYLETLTEIYEEAVHNGMKSQATVYIVNRLNKHLFEMFKEKKSYDKKQYTTYFISTYEKYLKIYLRRKVTYAIKYPLENPLKFIVKELLVAMIYRSYKRIGELRVP